MTLASRNGAGALRNGRMTRNASDSGLCRAVALRFSFVLVVVLLTRRLRSFYGCRIDTATPVKVTYPLSMRSFRSLAGAYLIPTFGGFVVRLMPSPKPAFRSAATAEYRKVCVCSTINPEKHRIWCTYMLVGGKFGRPS